MVQIYENPKGLAAAQVANQHNPEFAALNSITASYADGPITAAMAQMELDDKFGGLKGAIRQKQLERKWRKGDKAAEKQDNLNRIYYGQLGGKRSDFINLPEHEKLKAIYDRGLEFNRLNNGESYTYGNNPVPNMSQVGQVIGKDGTNTRTNITDLPTMNASGRLALENLRDINKMYPYLSSTNEGRDYLARLEQAYNANPDNLAALQPFLDEARSGKIPLVAPIGQKVADTYKKPQTYDESIMENLPWYGYVGYPLARLMADLQSNTDDYATQSENAARKMGFVPPRREEVGNGLFSFIERWKQNRARTKAANDYVENNRDNYVKNILQQGYDPMQTSVDDQVMQQNKLEVAQYIQNTYNEPIKSQDVQVAKDKDGNIILQAMGHIFYLGRDGFIREKPDE